ncbi:MAG: TrmH family RNA methyltransferase [Flavobacteriales bacterium]
MITKNQIKLVRSLQQKKFRLEHNLFVVEGQKPVNELLESDFKVVTLYVRKGVGHNFTSVEDVSSSEMERMSSMKSAPGILALVEMPSRKQITPGKNTLVLDGIGDPGNLGTIIRTADWFGMDHLVASHETVDEFNPKTIQSAMGSLFRVQIERVNLPKWLSTRKESKYGLDMNGQSMFSEMPKEGIFILGKESTGLSSEVRDLLDHQLSIPGSGNTESLNASVACGILLSEIFRASLT